MNNTEKNFEIPEIMTSPNSPQKVAKRILKTDGNLMKLTIASLLCIVAFIVPVILSNVAMYFGGVYYEEEEMMLTVFGVLASFAALVSGIIFLTLPAISGIYILARRIVLGENPSLSVMLLPFSSSKSYFRAILSGAMVIVRIMIVALPVAGGVALLPMALEMVYTQSFLVKLAVVCFVLLATAAAACIAVILQSYLFFFEALFERGMKFRRALSASARMCKGRVFEITKYLLGFSGAIALSVLSFGLTFVFYTVPLMTVSYFVYTDKFFYEQ